MLCCPCRFCFCKKDEKLTSALEKLEVYIKQQQQQHVAVLE
jgi:hypothetical protein